ncbi:MAG: protein-L-isoaspartate(D-aspartate) O-methyltransferase [Deltaproteobacteria bacterium]|nr:protein-L-isoaspartate(D-aspartate) O-methyltransferase [Deltaproteobacteria bacterium]
MDAIDLVGTLRAQGIHDERVLRAIAEVPRHRFVPAEYAELAWDDRPLPIGHGQTISQPFVVAFMIQALGLGEGARVLDVGTGSGYQAAVLARVCREVYTIEIVAPLLELARERFTLLGLTNVQSRLGDGWGGWPEAASFDGLVSASAAPRVPEPLVAQLAHGARLVLPVGEEEQRLVVVRRSLDGVAEVELSLPVHFVRMTGEAERP